VCVQAFGWGSDAEQLRLLRRLRRLLVPGGLLLLDHSSVTAITRRYRAEDRAEIGGAQFHFVRRYDPLTGRSGGEVRIRRPDGTNAVLPDDVRLYHPAEVRDLLVRAGFAITVVDADFTPGTPVTLDTRYVQFLATPAARPAPALLGHREPAPPGTVDLRSAPDEADLVAGAVAAAWAALDAPMEQARAYHLADPYGAGRAGAVLSPWIGTDAVVAAGAGATGLLHDLARLAAGGGVLMDPAGHPELAGAADGPVYTARLSDPAAAAEAVARHRPAITVLDRPGLLGHTWPVPAVRELAAVTAAAGGILVVDETCAGYLAPGDSAAPLTGTAAGLVVVRSMAKGYCCGGLRIGFAIASPDVADAVREVLTPLAASALALDVALALLRQPDPLAPLRERIAAVKPTVAALLADAGILTLPTDARVPWFVLPDEPAVRQALTDRQLIAKEVPVLEPDGRHATLLRLSVPLSAHRLDAVTAALSQRPGQVAGRPASAVGR
jgi:histidinol-phosphate/aromatic aminotransferase/cobyric acid decarboxylase-like protein